MSVAAQVERCVRGPRPLGAVGREVYLRRHDHWLQLRRVAAHEERRLLRREASALAASASAPSPPSPSSSGHSSATATATTTATAAAAAAAASGGTQGVEYGRAGSDVVGVDAAAVLRRFSLLDDDDRSEVGADDDGDSSSADEDEGAAPPPPASREVSGAEASLVQRVKAWFVRPEEDSQRQLLLPHCLLGDEQAAELACVALGDVLPPTRRLTLVNLSRNSLGDAAAALLGASLSTNHVLVSLDLSLNLIGDAGAAAIATGASPPGARGPPLRVLCLDGNSAITDAGVTALAARVRGNAVLSRAMSVDDCPRVSRATQAAFRLARQFRGFEPWTPLTHARLPARARALVAAVVRALARPEIASPSRVLPSASSSSSSFAADQEQPQRPALPHDILYTIIADVVASLDATRFEE